MATIPGTSAPSAAQPNPPKRTGRVSIIGVIGELLITAGALLLLFVAWQLWWTDIISEREYEAGRVDLKQEWSLNEPAAGPPKAVDPTYGKTFGLIYIPELKNKAWGIPVVEGTGREELMRGFGHHETSAVPGELGNFAIAGHRTTYGAPLHNIDQLERGDEVIVETKFGWYTYELEKQEIVKPWDGWILDPVPGLPADTKPREALITMYSCHPKFSAAERFVWFGRLVGESSKSEGPPPAIESNGGV